MYFLDTVSWLTEERLRLLLEQYRSLGPLPGIGLTFMKSFVPPLPTIAIVGLNGAVYGLWLGFLYSWIGLVAGCVTTFMIIRKIASHRYLRKWAQRPKVARSMTWVRQSGFSYVFLLSIFPVGPLWSSIWQPGLPACACGLICSLCVQAKPSWCLQYPISEMTWIGLSAIRGRSSMCCCSSVFPYGASRP